MTHNQIEYAKLKEDRRHNQETELNARNVLTETNRHNLALEGLQKDANAINSNHYAAMDAENARHNAAVESETNRHNIEQESIQAAQNELTRQLNAIRASELAEAKRHNIVSETISKYSAKSESDYRSTMGESAIINANAHERDSLTNFFNMGNTTSSTESNIRLNQSRIEDYQSQIDYRTNESYFHGVKSGSDLINDAVSTAVKVVNAAGAAGTSNNVSNFGKIGGTYYAKLQRKQKH